MEIEKALSLKIGDVVNFPSDRGNPAGFAKIKHIGTKTIHKNFKGVEFIWVVLQNGGTWPTNRLG